MQAEQVCPADPELPREFLCREHEASGGSATVAGFGEGSWVYVRLRHVESENGRVSPHVSTGTTRGRRPGSTP